MTEPADKRDYRNFKDGVHPPAFPPEPAEKPKQLVKCQTCGRVGPVFLHRGKWNCGCGGKIVKLRRS